MAKLKKKKGPVGQFIRSLPKEAKIAAGIAAVPVITSLVSKVFKRKNKGKKRKRGKLFCKPGSRRRGCKTKSKRWQKAFNRMYD
jgi:hypothetical protein|tara:strand:+ start:767 stop:1018 length:252 start_codon:yes stop_codon:yes gene_type:complete